MVNNESVQKRRYVNFITASIILAVVFWVVEGFVHGLFFNQPYVLRDIILPEAHELWMRGVVSFMIILSGILAQLMIGRNIRISRNLQLSEKKYSTLFRKAPVAITMVDTDGIISDCNRATELLTGFSHEELIGKPFQKLLTLDPKDLPMLQEKFDLLARGRDVAPYELEFIRKDGDRRWITVVNSLVISGAVVQGFLIMATDITEKKIAEITLRKLDDEKDLVLSSTRHLITYYNKNLEIIWANRATVETLGKELDDLIGRRCHHIWQQPEEWCRECPVQDAIETGRPQHSERQKRDGTSWIISGFPVRDDSGSVIGVVEVNREITGQKKVEQALQSRLEFEKVIATISTRFINMDTSEIDQGIEYALAELGRYLRVDRSYVFQLHNGRTRFSNTHEWCADGIPPQKVDLQDMPLSIFPWGISQLMEGKTIFVARVSELPPEEHRVKEILESGGIKSMITIPIYLGGTVMGFVGCDAVREERTWSDDTEAMLATVSGMFASALERKQVDSALHQSETMFRQFFENSPEYCYMISSDGTILNVNSAALEVLGYEKSELINESLSIIYAPESQLKMKRLFKQGQETGNIRNEEMTIVAEDGTRRTVLLSTDIIRKSDGTISHSISVQRDITERKHVQQALQDSEEKYRDMTDLLPEGVYEIDLEGTFIYVNEKALAISGYSREDVRKGLKAQDIFVPEERARVQENIQRILNGEDIGPQEYTAVKKDGTVYPVLIHSTALVHGSTVAGLRGVIVDITERKQAEKALKESEDKYRTLFESAPEAMVALAFDGTILNCNSIAAHMAGLPREAIIGKKFAALKILGGGGVKQYVSLFEKLVSGAERGRFEIELKLKGRTPFVLEVFPAFLYKDGKPYGVQCILREITKAKELEVQLKRAAGQWTQTFDAIRDAVCLLTEDRKVIRCNEAMTRLTDKHYKQIIGKTCCEIIHNRKRPQKNCPLIKMKRNLERVTEITRTQDGRWLSSTADPILDEKRNLTGIVLIISDITEQKRTEQELLNAQKLESLGVLAGGIAHDFNNLLLSIMGNIEISQLYAEPKSEIRKRLSNAYNALTRARDLVQQLLTFSKGGAPVKKTTSIIDVVKDTARFALRGTNIKCDFNIPDNIWPIDADAGQISQVINNLVINAQEAMSDGGAVDIGLENVIVSSDDGGPVPKGQYVRMTIHDHGEGILDEHLMRVFDPYFTTKDKGSGLGLATSYSIVKKHDGHISVTSKKGQGATFTIYLPASKKVPRVANEKTEEVSMGHGRILVMDDEDDILEIVSTMLNRCGYDVEVARSGEEAIETYTREMDAGRPYDAVILDLVIPGGLGGKEVAQRLLKIDPAAKLIISTGYATDPIVKNYQDHGFSGAIGKPYQMSGLSEAVLKVLGEKRASIALVDDDPAVLEILSVKLREAGFQTREFKDSESFMKYLKLKVPDLVLLDVRLPDGDGIQLCSFLKRHKKYAHIPVILVTGKDAEQDKVRGFQVGADDYITKPFSIRELIARVEVVLKRRHVPAGTGVLQMGKVLDIDIKKHRVAVKGKEVVLTPTEFKILTLLAEKPGWVFSRRQILDHVWGEDKMVVDRSVDVHIKNLKKKLGIARTFIKNKRGVGYKMEA